MKIGNIDAEIIGRKKHRFPNLACMKISGYHKKIGNDVHLLTTYDDIENYDKIFISKVFTNTPVPDGVLNLSWVEYGGTGFYFDAAPNLPDEIEHSFPDYDLYNDWINEYVENGAKRSEFKGYTDYSIGFLTRGCFRKCGFCVNKKYDRVFCHSALNEFYDPNRKKICLLDDNFLGFPKWREMLQELQATGKPFKFKQGLDERLLTDEKCEMLFNSKYDGDIIFAFDNVADYKIIEKKLQLIRRHTDKQCIFYVLVGFESIDEHDIENAFIRIELLMKYGCLPYIMRYENYMNSKYKGIYITLARWCNQFSFYKKMSFREFCGIAGKSSIRYLEEFERDHPEIAKRYFDLKFTDLNVGRLGA